MLMVGMEGSAVLAVRKVVVVAREVERVVAEATLERRCLGAQRDGGRGTSTSTGSNGPPRLPPHLAD